MMNTFYEKYRAVPKKLAFIDSYIFFTFLQLIILSLWGYFYSSFKAKIAQAAIYTAIGNITLLIALRVQLTDKNMFKLKREKIIFDFVLCSLLLYIGIISYMHLN
ncbi:dolichyl-diphosphooligosaccharide--protein glycosyltransferase subunit OST2, putative [Hepatocystis sp. ex Piliocolobus tephrosceles]|nr:dolichyl-diphosphooligosaccharide--protein glycosyltransferase subunit OST2, putative [Hepatocystis sp. ex Piliocolobus tephrosceles]